MCTICTLCIKPYYGLFIKKMLLVCLSFSLKLCFALAPMCTLQVTLILIFLVERHAWSAPLMPPGRSAAALPHFISGWSRYWPVTMLWLVWETGRQGTGLIQTA